MDLRIPLYILLLVEANCSSPAASSDDARIAVEAGTDQRSVDTSADRAVVDHRSIPAVTWHECDTAGWHPQKPRPASLECAEIDVPLDHLRPEQPSRFTLRVARQRSRSFPAERALFYLEGGPGGSAVESAGSLPAVVPNLVATFDLVYVDRRGTGGSSYLDCPAGFPSTKSGWIECAGLYAERDLSVYLTLQAAHDIDAVREILGYDKISLLGVSYGSRLALEVMQHHEDRIVAAVLDGVSTPETDSFGDSLKALDRGIGRLVEDCEQDSACTDVSPDLHADLIQRRQQLQKTPRPIKIGAIPTLETELLYLLALENLIGQARLRFKVPRAIHQAVNGKLALWNDLLSAVWGQVVTDTKMVGGRLTQPRALGPDVVAPALFIAVLCAEWLPNAGDTSALHALLAEQTWMNADHFERIGKAEACASWDIPPLAAQSRSLARSSVKTLLINGELDLNTFPEQGARALAGLPNGTNIIVPHATHGAGSNVPCATKIMNSFFLVDGDISAVDMTCLDDLSPPPW